MRRANRVARIKKRCLRLSQTCFSTIANVIALAHHNRNKKHLCYIVPRVSRIKILSRAKVGATVLLPLQTRKAGRAWKLLPRLLKHRFDFFFSSSLFLTTESSSIVKRRIRYTCIFSRYVKSPKRNLRNHRLSSPMKNLSSKLSQILSWKHVCA